MRRQKEQMLSDRNTVNRTDAGIQTQQLKTHNSKLITQKRDPRNHLNDLTGREWVHFLSSVEATAYPTTGPHSYSHKLRRVHPSPKPPQLIRRLVEFFTRQGEWVLDPFMGVGGSLLGCSLAGRNGVGIELSREYVETYHKVAAHESLCPQTAITADARQMLSLPQVYERVFDMVLTDPPYGDMM